MTTGMPKYYFTSFNITEKILLLLEFNYAKSLLTVEILPLAATCVDGVCTEFDIFIDRLHFGIIKRYLFLNGLVLILNGCLL